MNEGKGKRTGRLRGKQAAQAGEEEGRKGVVQAGSTSLREANSALGDPSVRPRAGRVCIFPNRLHTNRQGANLQRWERASGSSEEPEPVPSTSGVSEIALLRRL